MDAPSTASGVRLMKLVSQTGLHESVKLMRSHSTGGELREWSSVGDTSELRDDSLPCSNSSLHRNGTEPASRTSTKGQKPPAEGHAIPANSW